MIKTTTSTKRSIASTCRYAPLYEQRCARALDEAMYSTQGYKAWQRFDSGPGSAVFERLAGLHWLTRHDLRALGPQAFVPQGRSLAEGLASGQIEVVATSGTTGDRVLNVWYQPWWDASEAASWQLNAHALAAATGEHREAILTSPWCTGVPCEQGYLTQEERTLGRFLYLCERSDPTLWPSDLMDRMVMELNQFRPVLLEANPSFLARLCRYITAHRLRVESPGLIVLTYENPSILHYRQIRRVFDSPIASSYGSTEAGYVFMECEAGRLHQVSASCHVDFLPFAQEHGGPDIGRILVTTFDNPWRSLVRFSMGDVVRRYGHTPCPCGRHEGLTLASIEGRTISLTLTPEGRAVTQGQVDRALAEVPGLIEYQLFQTDAFTYHLRFVADAAPVRRVAGAAVQALAALYGPEAAITHEPVQAIAPDPPGKYCLSRSSEAIDPDTLLDPQYAPKP